MSKPSPLLRSSSSETLVESSSHETPIAKEQFICNSNFQGALAKNVVHTSNVSMRSLQHCFQ